MYIEESEVKPERCLGEVTKSLSTGFFKKGIKIWVSDMIIFHVERIKD